MTFSQQINDLFDGENWREARRLLEGRLREEPDNHWLLTRLGTTYYEQRDYAKALEFTQKAYDTFVTPGPRPVCPLVLWDLASTQEMLGDDRAALSIYQELFARGTRRLADDECGEGLAWARSLLSDCLYSVAGCLHRLGRKDEALRSMQQHLQFRAMGVRSIYPLGDARTRLRKIAGSSNAAIFEHEIGETGRTLAKMLGRKHA